MSAFTYTSKAGVTVTMPLIGDIPAGAFRAARKLGEVDMMFTLIESVADTEALAALDAIPHGELDELFKAWQAAAGVTLPES